MTSLLHRVRLTNNGNGGLTTNRIARIFTKRVIHSQRKIIASSVKRPSAIKTESSYSLNNSFNNAGSISEAKVVTNFCNIQMISNHLHQQLFPSTPRSSTEVDKSKLGKCRKHLEAHHLWQQNVSRSAEVNIALPPLEGANINEHFRKIAEDQTRVYRKGLDKLILGIPEKPSRWVLQEGWTRYCQNQDPVRVPYPEEDAYVFDIEVCQDTGQVPTLAVAVSSEAWYGWCSPILVTGTDRNPNAPMLLNELIPFETTDSEGPETRKIWKPKIIVGHNVSYDRARIKEQYFLQSTRARFLDTMSMHIAISGITSFQRALKMSIKKNSKESNGKEELLGSVDMDWNGTSSLNNLNDVYKLYCKNEDISKEERNVFITGKIKDIKADFQNLMNYCAFDVKATHEILEKVVPLFFDRFPHPATFAGTLEMGMAYLPINENWTKYINKSESTYLDLQQEIKTILMERANDALKLLPGEKYKDDPWLWDLDWKVPRTRRKKKVSTESESNLPSNNAVQPEGTPAWYRKLFYKPSDEDYQPGPAKLSTSMRIVPKLLRLCWFGCPLYHSKTQGWGFLIKSTEPAKPDTLSTEFLDEEETDVNADDAKISAFPYEQWELIWERNRRILEEKYHIGKSSVSRIGNDIRDKREDSVQDLKDFIKGLDALTTLGMRSSEKKERKAAGVSTPHPKCEFRPLPHKDGASHRVGNPLSKDFLNKIEDHILTSADGEGLADRAVRVSKMLTYWRNSRDRIMGQLAVWLKNPGDDGAVDSFKGPVQGAILPLVIVAGTLTRRAVEPTWLTASNAYSDRVGSELKGLVQAPAGYHFVGADVDSQELWIASIIGDSQFASIHGCTALGWMTLQGSKNAGTDMHSKTASLIGIDRNQAKILNYGRIYGAGVTFAERLLLQFNPKMTPSDARSKARAMYSMTKGEKKYLLNEEGRHHASTIDRFASKTEEPLARKEMTALLRQLQFPPQDFMEMVDKIVWDGGTESYMFNRLEEIAQKDSPETPFLHCQLSRSLVPAAVKDNFMTSRVNWVVQSSAVDYLHLMLTCMRWLFDKYSINGRFAISLHDEVRYLVSSEDRYRAALALQVTNLLTRAMCSYQLEMYDLPQSVAFFSCVDIDKVIRKEVNQDCVTPSNPQGLWKGYGIPQGEALDVYELLKKTGKSLDNDCNCR